MVGNSEIWGTNPKRAVTGDLREIFCSTSKTVATRKIKRHNLAALEFFLWEMTVEHQGIRTGIAPWSSLQRKNLDPDRPKVLGCWLLSTTKETVTLFDVIRHQRTWHDVTQCWWRVTLPTIRKRHVPSQDTVNTQRFSKLRLLSFRYAAKE